MTSGERVRLLRKHLDLSLEKFGEPIALKRSALSMIETGRNNLSYQALKAICREYGVSEEWLRDGKGDVFVPVTRNEKIARFAGELMKDETPEFRRQIIEIFADLKDEQWVFLAEFAEKLADIVKK